MLGRIKVVTWLIFVLAFFLVVQLASGVFFLNTIETEYKQSMALNDETDKFMLLNQVSTSVLRTRSLINGGFIHSLLESKGGINYNESVGRNHFINEAEKSLNEAKYQFKLFQLQPLQFKNKNYDDLEVEFNKYQKKPS